jgi:hypothetical protein
MYAIVGSLLVAGVLLAMALLALLVRNPGSPAWLRNDLTTQLGAVLITGALGLGLAWLAMAPAQLAADALSLAEVGFAAAMFVGLALTLRLLRLRSRLAVYDGAAAGPTLAVSNPGPLPPRTPRPRSGGRKAA